MLSGDCACGERKYWGAVESEKKWAFRIMRAERTSTRRLLVFVLVAGCHACIFLILAHRQLIEPRDKALADESMSMILFPLTAPRVIERVPVAKKPLVHQAPVRPPTAVAVTAAPPSAPTEDSGNAIDWNLEKERVAGSSVQNPKYRRFGARPSPDLDGPHRSRPSHTAGESYRDMYGDTVVWINARCYMVSEAPQLGTPEVFKHLQPTRAACIREGPSEGELFKDLPEYKKRHPQ